MKKGPDPITDQNLDISIHITDVIPSKLNTSVYELRLLFFIQLLLPCECSLY